MVIGSIIFFSIIRGLCFITILPFTSFFFSALIDKTFELNVTLMSFLSNPGISTVTMRVSFSSCRSIGGNTNSKNSLDLSSISLKKSLAIFFTKSISSNEFFHIINFDRFLIMRC